MYVYNITINVVHNGKDLIFSFKIPGHIILNILILHSYIKIMYVAINKDTYIIMSMHCHA